MFLLNNNILKLHTDLFISNAMIFNCFQISSDIKVLKSLLSNSIEDHRCATFLYYLLFSYNVLLVKLFNEICYFILKCIKFE